LVLFVGMTLSGYLALVFDRGLCGGFSSFENSSGIYIAVIGMGYFQCAL
jgi:hypothetical protein